MRKYIISAVIVLIAAVAVVIGAGMRRGGDSNQPSTDGKEARTIYDFTLKDIDGREVKLEEFRGKAVMIVNVASRCGYTPQYEGLEAVYRKYREQGFVVLGFPANNFGGQEPGSDKEIKFFCSTRYNVSFPMFSKISVKGADMHPFYQYLTAKSTNPGFAGDIKWNFNKFVVDKTGRVIARFDSGDEPESRKVTQVIEQALAAK